MPIAAVVADANVLLSAAIGRAALKVFSVYGIEVHVAAFNAAEVEEYLPRLSSKYDLPEPFVKLQWKILAKVIHPLADYRAELERASQELLARDPDDAHPLALARALGLPLWSNDNDLQGHGVACLPTAQLLKILETQDGEE